VFCAAAQGSSHAISDRTDRQGYAPLAWATLTRELDLLVFALQVDPSS
jgi:hypothetical protein